MARPETSALDRLTEQQVLLLRLVAAGVSTSKELERKTGLKSTSIDTYLHAACRALGADGRKEAATRFLELEHLFSQSPSQLRTRRLAGWLKTAISAAVRGLRRFVTGLPIGGQFHSFSWWRVAAEMFRVALLGAAGVTFLMLIVRGMMRTLS